MKRTKAWRAHDGVPIAILALSACLAAPVADAALAGKLDSVAADQTAFAATERVTPQVLFDVHELSAASGTMIREYAARDGTVFAVAWRGRTPPDLKQLLGARYTRYASEAEAHRAGHHLLSINTPDLVVTATRFQRTSSGIAHVPALLPAGVSARDLR